MNDNKNLMVRICILLLIFIIPINIFQAIFSQATLIMSYFLLNLLSLNPSLGLESIIVYDFNIIFVPACVATSAYYLFTALLLLTKDISLKKRAMLLIFGYLMLLIVNVIRIDILILILLKYGSNYFERLHLIIWKFISSIFVAIVWILLTYLLKIKSIPIYSDFISLVHNIKKSK